MTRPTRARDLIAAEWIKIWSLRSTWWMLLCAIILSTGVGALVTGADAGQWDRMTPAQRAGFDPLPDTFIGFLVAQLIFASLGALAITGEYSSGLIRTTFAAAPGRAGVLTAKATAVSAVAFLAGLVATLASFGVGQAILSRRHLDVSITDPASLRAIIGAVVYLVAAALLGLGLGALLRHAAGAIAVLVAVLFLAPELLHGTTQWLTDISNALPGTAIRRLISMHPWQGAPAVPTAFLTIVAYPAVVLAVAAIIIRRRDV